MSKYGADATRFACAEAGDTVDDANFVEENADGAILKISTFEMWLKEFLPNFEKNTRPPSEKGKNPRLDFFDVSFENEMKLCIQSALKNYEDMKFRNVVKYGFYNFHSIKYFF